MSATSRRNRRKGRKTTARADLVATVCPMCGGRGRAIGPEQLLVCRKCGGLYDSQPDEGGDYSTFNPAARLERAETQRENRYGQRYDSRGQEPDRH